MKKMAKAKQQAAEAAKTAETVVKTAAPAKEVKPTTEKTLHTEAAEGKIIQQEWSDLLRNRQIPVRLRCSKLLSALRSGRF